MRLLFSTILLLLLVFASSVLGTSPSPTQSPVVTTKSPTPPTKAPTRAPTPPTKAPTLPVCPDDPTDTDGDGITDCKDKCPTDFKKINPGMCGCGVSDTLVDNNRDGIPECANGEEPILTGYYLGNAQTLTVSKVLAMALLLLVQFLF